MKSMPWNKCIASGRNEFFIDEARPPYMEPGSFVVPTGSRVAVIGCSSDMTLLSSL